MKSSIRTFVLAAIAAASFATTTHSASAQHLYARGTSADYTIPSGGAVVTVNAVIVPSAGTYVLVGQQMLWTASSTVATIVECYTANQAGTPLPYGAYSMTTVPAGGQNYVTVPLNGYFTTTGYTQINVNCRYYSNGTSATTGLGTITATSTD